MAAKIIENHKIITMEHDLRNEGYYLIDNPENSTSPKILIITDHSRRIDDRFYKVTEYLYNNPKNFELRTIETDMSEEEIENFETNWELYWKPALTTKEGAILQGSILN